MVPLKYNIAHARDFLLSHERMLSRLISLHQPLIEVEAEATTQSCTRVYIRQDKYYPPRRFICVKVPFLVLTRCSTQHTRGKQWS